MYVIVTENLHDQAFIDKYTLGFSEDQMPESVADNESLVAYLTGRKDGMAKTRNGQRKSPKSRRTLSVSWRVNMPQPNRRC